MRPLTDSRGVVDIHPRDRSHMTVEIRGTEFINKGAHLMLLSILEQIRNRHPQVRVAMRAFASGSPFERRAELGLFQLVTIGRLPKLSNLASRLIPDLVRCRLGVVLEREIGLVLDAGGFAYSDQRGHTPTRRAARAIRRWKRNATRVVLLPQAFGPFEHKRIQRDFRVIVGHADLIYARDARSYQYITDLVGTTDKVRRAPDFTNLIASTGATYGHGFAGRVCIVPNQRMIDKTPVEIGRAYVRMMACCARVLDEMQLRPFILLHEGPGDRDLAAKINAEAELRMNVVDEQDPLEIRGVIGSCLGVIGSRYHALVSALSQSVPALAVGWSHKYKELFDDYGFAQGMLSVHNDAHEIRRKVEMIVRGRQRDRIIRRITEHGAIERDRARLMWDDIFRMLAG